MGSSGGRETDFTATKPRIARITSGTPPFAVLQVAAASGDATLYDRYVARMRQLTSDPEQYCRFFNALPYFRDPALVKRILDSAPSPDVRSQDSAILINGLLGASVEPIARLDVREVQVGEHHPAVSAPSWGPTKSGK